MNQNNKNIIADFVKFCQKELNIQRVPIVKLTANREWVAKCRSFGEYNPQERALKVYYAGRNTADVLRSLAHELVHHRQEELGMIEPDSGGTGSEIENDANAMAGVLLREYGKQNVEIYDLAINEKNDLTEAKQVGPLYHFTNYRSMLDIIKSNFVLTTKHVDIQPYVSFTRNKRLTPDSIATEVRIAVDGNRLSDRYTTMPHADVQAGYGRTSVDESEERISLLKYPKGIDISKYITAIDVKKPNYEADYDDEDSFGPPSLLAYEELLKLLKAKNIDFNLVNKYN